MRFPENLKKGGTIGFVAPSFGCTTEPYKSAFANAQKKWKEMGYQLDLGPNCYAEHGIGISAAPEECGKELTEYYVSEKNDCLISCGGGELMCEDLDYVDFEKIRKAPAKWYLGYSDNTHFTYLLPTLCDTAAVYGPCASDFGMEPWHKSVADAFGVLTGEVRTVRGYEGWERDDVKGRSEENPYLPYQITELRVLRRFPYPSAVRTPFGIIWVKKRAQVKRLARGLCLSHSTANRVAHKLFAVQLELVSNHVSQIQTD